MNTRKLFGMLLMVGVLLPSPGRAQAPAWTFDPSRFEASMNLTGVVEHEGVVLTHPGDRLAAFVGEEVRGVATPLPVGGQMLFFLTVYADTDGETITFKVYDAAADVVREIAETARFETNAVRGLVSAPLRWTARLPGTGAPTWSVEPSAFTVAMSITGTLVLPGGGGQPGDLVAAFVGEEVRGVAAAVAVGGTYLYFLTVYANGAGEAVTFKAYEAATGRVYPVAEALTFTTNAVVGSVTAPFAWTADAASATAVEPLDGDGPAAFRLDPGYPNPFGTQTRLTYTVAAAGPVRLTVHDALGREVARLVDRPQAPGRYGVTFTATGLPSGVYLARLQAAGQVAIRPLTLIK